MGILAVEIVIFQKENAIFIEKVFVLKCKSGNVHSQAWLSRNLTPMILKWGMFDNRKISENHEKVISADRRKNPWNAEVQLNFFR